MPYVDDTGYFVGAGGYKFFGPTYNSTPYVRLGYEGILGSKPIGSTLVSDAINNQTQMLNAQTQEGYAYGSYPLAGLIAAVDANGNLVPAGSSTAKAPIGLFREDLGDMMNASMMGTYYFGFGEYYVAESRVSSVYSAAGPAVGDALTYNANGQLTKVGASDAVSGGVQVGFVVYFGEYAAGNMYANAGLAANGGNFLGFKMQNL